MTTFELYHKHSADSGATWSDEERLTHGADGPKTDKPTDPPARAASSAMYPVLARDGKNVHIVWMGGGLFYLHSADGGATWDPPAQIVSGKSNPSPLSSPGQPCT